MRAHPFPGHADAPTAVEIEPLTDVYMPVVRGFLIALGCYYSIIAVSHPFYEHGLALAVLDGEPAVSARHIRQAATFVLRHRVLPNFNATGEGIAVGEG